ncbi:hypothetical protein [Streptomyces sp. MBT84]|nr:hypothetical protein [Streptomyces sp. MBT84]
MLTCSRVGHAPANATAHKVLQALRAEGLTYTEPGLGSFVAKPEA